MERQVGEITTLDGINKTKSVYKIFLTEKNEIKSVRIY